MGFFGNLEDKNMKTNRGNFTYMEQPAGYIRKTTPTKNGGEAERKHKQKLSFNKYHSEK